MIVIWPLRFKSLSIILFIGVGHLLAGLSIALDPRSGLVTPFSEIMSLGGSTAAPILIIAGALAIGTCFEATPTAWKIFMIVPQQSILLLQASSLILTLFLGHYPDGYVPNAVWPRLFIFNDQIWSIFCFLAHTWEVIGLAGRNGAAFHY